MSNKKQTPLRKGITTGTCAAAAAKAAAICLLTGEQANEVAVQLPGGPRSAGEAQDAAGGRILVKIEDIQVCGDEKDGLRKVTCFVIKDAGDDPDVTDGIRIGAIVHKIQSDGIIIEGGEGVGRVTKPGLKIPVGEAAINPVPRSMIEHELREVSKQAKYKGGLEATILAIGGEETAKRTMNERLGIIGGISILGTSGIVEPMSERAIVDTIKTEIDVNLSAGKQDLLITPGNYGRDFAKNKLNLDIEDAVKCSNFIGETLDYCVQTGVKGITLIGHAGKLMKLAGGIMNTHSKTADGRMEILAAHAGLAGADSGTIKEVLECITIDAALEIIADKPYYHQVLDSIRRKIGFHIKHRTGGALNVRYIVFTETLGVLIDGGTRCRESCTESE